MLSQMRSHSQKTCQQEASWLRDPNCTMVLAKWNKGVIALESVHLIGTGRRRWWRAARGALGAQQGRDRTAAALLLAASQATVPGGEGDTACPGRAAAPPGVEEIPPNHQAVPKWEPGSVNVRVKMPRGPGLASPPVAHAELTCTPRGASVSTRQRCWQVWARGRRRWGSQAPSLLCPARPCQRQATTWQACCRWPSMQRDVLLGRTFIQNWKPYHREQPAPTGGQDSGVARGQPQAPARDHAMHTPFPLSAWRRRRLVLPWRGCLRLRLCSDAEPVSVASAAPDPAPHQPQRFVSALPGAPTVVTAGLFLPAGLGFELVKGYAEQYLLEADI